MGNINYCCDFDEILNSQNVPKILPNILVKLSAIFRLLELFPGPPKYLVEVRIY